jgi:hypothetical protein
MTILYNHKIVATVTGAEQAARSTSTALKATIQDGILRVIDENGFGRLLSDLLLRDTVIFAGHGVAKVKFQTPLGVLVASDVKFQEDFVLRGFQLS